MSEDYEHQKNQEELKKYFQKNISEFFDETICKKWGRYLTIEKAKIKNINGRVPDLMIENIKNKNVWIGEAKTSSDFNKFNEFRSRNIIQLKCYCEWIRSNFSKFNSHLLVYSVPITKKLDTKNEIKKVIGLNKSDINFKVISNFND